MYFTYIFTLLNNINLAYNNHFLKMQNLSLLVDCSKIIKWLEQRKKLPKDWYNYVKAAEEKIKILIKDHETFSHYSSLQNILKENKQNFTYLDVNRFIEQLLKSDLAQQKSLIFGYADKRVKQWTSLKKFMDSKCVGLLNNAKFIQQTLNFDLPGLNKNIEILDNQLANLKRKIDFNQNTIFQQQKQMKKQNQLVGIQATQSKHLSIEQQVPLIIKQTPNFIENLQNFIKENDLKRLLKIYYDKLTYNGTQRKLQSLEYLIQNGNEYFSVFKGKQSKKSYEGIKKYTQFQNWKPVNQWQIIIQGSNLSNQQQKDLQKKTIIQQKSSRQDIMYDLNELLYFYKGLKYECSSESKNIRFDSNIINLTQTEIQASIGVISQVINLLTSKKLLTPLELMSNKKSYQLFVTKFNNFQKNILTLQSQIRQYRKQIEELEVQREQEVQKLRNLRKKVIQVKKVQQKLITELVGKDVKIVGEINKIN